MVRSLMIVLGALSLAAPVSSFVPPSIASSALVPLAQPRSLSARAERCVAGVAAQTRVTLRGATFCARRGAHLELDMSASSVPTPQSIGDMMQEAARAVKSAQDAGLKRVMVEVPLPITGGTELDDWPGGQGQKYETLRPMVQEVLRVLGFSKEEAEARVKDCNIPLQVGVGLAGGAEVAVQLLSEHLRRNPGHAVASDDKRNGFNSISPPVTKTDNAPGDCLRTLDRIVGDTSSKIGPA